MFQIGPREIGADLAFGVDLALFILQCGTCIHIQERTGQATGRSVCLSVISPIYRYVQDNDRTTRLDQGIYSQWFELLRMLGV